MTVFASKLVICEERHDRSEIQADTAAVKEVLALPARNIDIEQITVLAAIAVLVLAVEGVRGVPLQLLCVIA